MTLKRLARPLWIPGMILLAVALAFAHAASGDPVNIIGSIKSAPTGNVDIELRSSTPFIQSDVPVLKVANNEYTISRAPEDGSLYVRIFSVPKEDFTRKLKHGDRVQFQYGRGTGRRAADFGTLDKTRLDK